MSQVTEQEIKNFESLVLALLQPNNEIRSQAETSYTELQKSDIAKLLTILMQLSRSCPDVSIRDMCSLLLRKNFKTVEFWQELPVEVKDLIRTELLKSLQGEPEQSIRKKICDAISDLAFGLAENKELQTEWSDLLPFMFQLTKSPEEHLRESSLFIFSQLVSHISEQMLPYFAVLKDIFTSALHDSSHRVRLESLRAVAGYVENLSPKEHPEQFQVLQQFLPDMLETVRGLLSANLQEEAKTALEIFVEIAGSEPAFLRPSIVPIYNAMMTITSSQQLDSSIRHSALEFLVTITESRPGMMRKIPNFVSSFLPVILKLLVEIEENEDWNKGEEFDADDEDCVIGEESLDRFAIALGGKLLAPALFQILPSLLNSDDWKQRHAALTAISLVAEGCYKFLLPHLDNLIEFVVPRFQDPHPRVRWAACNTIGQLASDFPAVFQEKYHQAVLTGLIQAMGDSENPRVQSHGASAVINFCEHSEPEYLEPYLDSLLSNLFKLMAINNQLIQEQAITAVAAVADCIESGFQKYYDTFIPYLKTILVQATSKDHRVLRGKAMECISLIGVAVGKEKFGPDAKEVMDILIRADCQDLEDPQISFQFQAWARLCKCLGKDFVPYFEFVMPPLLKAAKIEPDVVVTESNETGSLDEGWEVVPVGDKTIGIKTSVLEEKSTACNMLFCYADELKEWFYPYVEPVSQIMLPLLKFYYHDAVRSAAASIVPALLLCVSEHAKKNNDPHALNYLRELWHRSFPLIMDALEQEIDVEILETLLESLQEAIDILGENSLNQEHLVRFIKVLQWLMEDYFSRRQDRDESSRDQDFDVEEGEKLEDEQEKEEDLLNTLVDVCGKLVKTHKDQYLSCFNEALPAFVKMLEPQTLAHDKQVSLCLFDDIVELGGPGALSYYQHFVPSLLENSLSPHPGLRQASVYGLGVCAQFGGETFGSVVPQALMKLTQVIQSPESRKDEFLSATENAISSVARLCRYQSSLVPVKEILGKWILLLPVQRDVIESKVIYENLCFFLENPEAAQMLFGENFSQFNQVLKIFAEIVGTELISEETSQKIPTVLKSLHSSFPDVFTSAFNSLSDEQKGKLKPLC